MREEMFQFSHNKWNWTLKNVARKKKLLEETIIKNVVSRVDFRKKINFVLENFQIFSVLVWY